MRSFSIPIKLADSFEGLAESKGLLSIKDESLLVQFQTKDAILGVVKSDLTEVKIPLANLVGLSYKKSLFGNKLILNVDDLRIIAGLPESENNEVVFSIARKDIDEAIDFVRVIRSMPNLKL